MSPDCHFPKLRTKEMSDSLTPVTKIYQNWPKLVKGYQGSCGRNKSNK